MLDVLIVGGGPAGIAAGIQARHMGLDIKILEERTWGGRLALARKVENFPGLARPMSGTQVVEALVAQARNKGLALVWDSGESIDYRHGRFVVQGRLDTYECRTVIVATGVKPKKLSVPGIGDRHPRLFYVWSDLPETLNKRVAIIGGGEAAFDQACSLAERGAHVIVVLRAHTARAFHGLVQEARQLGVRVILNATITRAEQEAEDLSLHLADAGRSTLHVDYVLVSVGVVPSEIAMSGDAASRMDQGLYFSGDLCSQHCRQAAIAFGDGIKKTMMVYEYLKG
jgi:thioredoxin reductase (NADPH)